MKNIYFCQFNDNNPDSVGFYYFPYSVGVLWAYAQQFSDIRDEYCVKDFFLVKDKFQNIIDSMSNPDIVCLSTYLWNEQYNLELARKIKKQYPDCKIVYGGPSTSSCSREWLHENTVVDFVIYGEGEIAFVSLLRAMRGNKKLNEIKSIAYRQDADVIITAAQPRISDLTQIPSPYLLGLFDNLVERYKNNPKVTLNAILESDRGCPYACTFCDWGGVTYSKIKRRELYDVFDEITWVAKNKIEMLNIANANFLIFRERDEKIIDHIIACKKQYGFPKFVDFGGWSKNQNVDSVDVAKKLYDNGLLRRFNISIQTDNETSLEAMKRTNSPHIEKILARAIKLDIPVSMDLIFGSPCDTYENTIELLATGYEKNLHYYGTPFMVLTGSEANEPDYQKRYGIKTRTIRSRNSYIVDEYQTFITGTSTMTEKEYQHLLVWFWFSQLLEGGYTNLIRQAANRVGMTTREFYDRIIDYIISSPLLSNYYNTKVDHSMQFSFDKFEPYPNAEEFIELIETNIHKFFYEMEMFCNTLNLEVSVQDIIKIQKHIKSRPTQNPILDFESNVYEYLNGSVLKTNIHRYEFDYSIARNWFGLREQGTNFFFWLSTRANQLWQSQITRLS